MVLFTVSAVVALLATVLAVTRTNGVHAVLYLVVSLLGTAGVTWALGAPFAAALEVIVYAGAIVVLFVFVVLLLGQRPERIAEERAWTRPAEWAGPIVLAGVLLVGLVIAVPAADELPAPVDAEAVGLALYGPYVLAVEAASFLLLSGLVGAWHVGRPTP